MKMRQLDRLSVPAGGDASLKSGGNHLMLFDLKKDFAGGDVVPVTLVFDNGLTVDQGFVVKTPKEMAQEAHGE